MPHTKPHREILANLLAHPPCPVCGAYDGMLIINNSHMDFLFGECESEYCLDTSTWEVADGEMVRVVIRGGK